MASFQYASGGGMNFNSVGRVLTSGGSTFRFMPGAVVNGRVIGDDQPAQPMQINIFVNGEKVESKIVTADNNVTVTVKGDVVTSVSTENAPLTVEGNVGGNVKTSNGTARVGGTVTGSVTASNGSVHCGDVGGNATASNGSVHCGSSSDSRKRKA